MPASLKRACVAEMLRAYIRRSLYAITSSTYTLPLPGSPPATVYDPAEPGRRPAVPWPRQQHRAGPPRFRRDLAAAAAAAGVAREHRRGDAPRPEPARTP